MNGLTSSGMGKLDAFVPVRLLRRLPTRDRAASVSFSGTALFADISNYTTLAEKLCSQGPKGLEALGDLLDTALGAWARTVMENGGEVASFAGDAILAYWAADEVGHERAARNALTCRHQLRLASETGFANLEQTLRDKKLHISLEPKDFALHVGMAEGDLWAAYLGGAKGRWHLFLAGPAVHQATRLAAAAQSEQLEAEDPREMPRSSAAGADGQGACHRAIPDRPPDRRAPSPSSKEIEQHVPRIVGEYVGRGFAQWLPQRRTVSALFIQIKGLDDRDRDALVSHQRAISSLQMALYPYTTSSGSLLLDGNKGLVFRLCLGMPNDSYPNDALRAVRAALKIESELGRLGLACSSGLDSGESVCMTLGDVHYVPVGACMHTSARLMQKADGGILCTDAIARQVRNTVTLSPEPVHLKGMGEPLTVYRVMGIPSVDHVQVERVFGREFEQTRIDRCLTRLEQARGTLLWIVGDAGLGKTALVQYLERAASKKRIGCLVGNTGRVGHTGRVEENVAYSAWRPIFGSLLGGDDGWRALPQAQRLHLVAEMRNPQLAPLLNAVLPGFLEETAFVRGLSAGARGEATVAVLSDFIHLHATSRFVLVLEDCHWMDSASWRLTGRVAHDSPQSLIVLTERLLVDPEGPGRGEDARYAKLREVRNEVRDRVRGEIRCLDNAEIVRLSPLSDTSVRQIVQDLVAPGHASDELIDEVLRRAKGSPLLAREYTFVLRSRESPSLYDDDAPQIAPAGSDPLLLPIASRLDALRFPAPIVLKCASVVGEEFDMPLVEIALNDLLQNDSAPQTLAADALKASLETLEGEQLLVRSAYPGRFAFRHARIREAAYEQLLPSQRQRIHRTVAEALERRHQSDLPQHYTTLAHHWGQASEMGPTVKYGALAAEQALASGAFVEAEGFLQICLDEATNLSSVSLLDRIQWLRQLADAREGMGDLEARHQAASTALRLGGAFLPEISDTGGDFVGKRGLEVRTVARFLRFLLRSTWLPRKPRRVDDQLVLELARAYRHYGEVCYFKNRMLEMLYCSVSAAERALGGRDSVILTAASVELGGVLSVGGFRFLGEPVLNRGMTRAEKDDDQSAQSYGHMLRGLYHVGVGNWAAAAESIGLAQNLCEPIEERVTWTNAQAVRYWLHVYQNDRRASEIEQGLRERAGQTGNRQHRAWAGRFRALWLLRWGTVADLARAKSELDSALSMLGGEMALNELLPCYGLKAYTEYRLAQKGQEPFRNAHQTALQGMALMAEIDRPIGHATLEGFSALTHVVLRFWGRETKSRAWSARVNTCLAVMRRYRNSFPIGRARYEIHLGDYSRFQGRLRDAREHYMSGRRLATKYGMKWDVDVCQMRLNEIGGPRGTRRSAGSIVDGSAGADG